MSNKIDFNIIDHQKNIIMDEISTHIKFGNLCDFKKLYNKYATDAVDADIHKLLFLCIEYGRPVIYNILYMEKLQRDLAPFKKMAEQYHRTKILAVMGTREEETEGEEYNVDNEDLNIINDYHNDHQYME